MDAIRALTIVGVLGIFANSALADYHYASHEGSDEYPYTSWETAADSIQKAIDASSPHDTVYIGAGDWLETVATGYYDTVAIIGMGMDSTFCYSDSYHTPVMTIDYDCYVEGITFEHLDGWITFMARAHAGYTVSDCRFRHSSIEGIQSAGGIAEISNCIFDSCASAIENPFGQGNYLIKNNLVLNSYELFAIRVPDSRVVAENNIIIIEPETETYGITSNAYSWGTLRNNVVKYGRQFGLSVSNSIVTNNSVDSMTSSLRGGIAAYDSAINNSVSNCYKGIIAGSPLILNYNNFWNNVIDIDGTILDSVGNTYNDPMYISSLDFHLQAYSPLIDAGDPNIIDPDGSRSDIGAYGGPLGELYEYHDLPPRIPDSLSGEIVADTAYISWRFNTEDDFANYYLYRDTVSGFQPNVFNLIAEPDTSFYVDADIIPGLSYYYRISAIDDQGNMSDYSEELVVNPTGIWNGMGAEPPRITTIKSNYPNPFNSNTTIVYYVANLGPIPADIKIEIYDITGRKVRTLLHEKKEVGAHRITWDSRNDAGSDCPSGVYFAKIRQWNLSFLGGHKKLILMR